MKIKVVTNIIFALLLAFLLYQRLPTVFNNYRLEGQQVGELRVDELVQHKVKSRVLSAQESYVLLFWATWCAPCKLEMQRLKNSVDSKNIPREKLLAINLGEDRKTILKFIKQNKFPFTFIDDKGVLLQKFQVRSTPTIVLVERGVARSVSSGVSLLGIYKAEGLFK